MMPIDTICKFLIEQRRLLKAALVGVLELISDGKHDFYDSLMRGDYLLRIQIIPMFGERLFIPFGRDYSLLRGD
jgi:hypothetical protein